MIKTILRGSCKSKISNRRTSCRNTAKEEKFCRNLRILYKSISKNILVIFILFTVQFFTFSDSRDDFDENLMRKIGQMFITTFSGTSFINSSDLPAFIDRYKVGGLLFMGHNIVEKEQTREFVSDIKNFAKTEKAIPLFLCIDEEGEFVRRLKSENGFRIFDFSAFDIGEIDDQRFTRMVYQEMADDLKYAGLNFNFAPAVDIDVNLNNPIIARFKRSFSSDAGVVVRHAGIMIDVMRKNNILTALKHFPGHGSSVADSHRGITDITDTYEKIEMEPFTALRNKANAVMIGHLVHKEIDPEYPATISKKWITDILKKEMRYRGLIITDDINMRGLTSKYSLEEIILKSVDAGNDMIIIASQELTAEAVTILYNLVKEGKIPLKRIDESYRKITSVKRRYRI